MLPFRSEAEIERAIPVAREHLARGGLLAYPTETVYGLGSDPTVPALEALARLKGRAPDKPFLLLVSSRAMVEEWGLVLSTAARALAAAFWPGPLTLVLRGGEGKLPDQLRDPANVRIVEAGRLPGRPGGEGLRRGVTLNFAAGGQAAMISSCMPSPLMSSVSP